MRAIAPLLALLLLLLVASCGVPRPAGSGPRGTLRFQGTPPDALVEVDGVHLGPMKMLGEQGLLLRPGDHRIIVRFEGYFPKYKIVSIEDGAVTILEVHLRPIPD